MVACFTINKKHVAKNYILLRFSTKFGVLMQQFVLVTIGKLGGVINHSL